MTYEELCNKNIGDMNKDELFEFSIGLLGEVHDYEKEIVRLNNIIDKAIHYINLNQDSKTLCLNYEQLKALRGILRQDEFYLRLFEEQLEELKVSNKE